jgi:hypothetical protein
MPLDLIYFRLQLHRMFGQKKAARSLEILDRKYLIPASVWVNLAVFTRLD